MTPNTRKPAFPSRSSRPDPKDAAARDRRHAPGSDGSERGVERERRDPALRRTRSLTARVFVERTSQAFALLSVVVLAVPGFAQGSDSCASPTPVVGAGPHAFNNAGAVVTANIAPPCASVTRDVWFRWTAPTTGEYTAATCGGTSLDTVVAVYDGAACPVGAAIGCNDDGCADQTRQSRALFAAVAGSSYVIQIGKFGGGAGGSGTFRVDAVPPCPLVPGPDLIVRDLHEIVNHGISGGLGAITFGVSGCNLGDVPVNWITNTPDHPVHASNLYRYLVVDGSGRFEQIGLSWAAHGVPTSNLTLCCVQCFATDSAHLYPGCSNDCDANFIGEQALNGPRRQVDASTGSFVYPPANPGWSGAIARRLQYLVSDVLTPVETRFFGESHYVAPDEAAAGNDDNNASYRELHRNGTAFNLTSATVPQAPAIAAWLACEPGVAIEGVHADGLFHVAHKVTDLGGGQYHYEYAVHNLNSHRSGGSFSIPVGSATITNVGFHDVTYRNGDGEGSVNHSDADWTVTNVGGVLTWATETQAANANANALRWGTTYNFRFDANAAPVAGTAELGLWRAGSPASVTATVGVPGAVSSFAFCFGDGTGTACPCANHGATGNGCANSVNAAGGNLSVAGTPSISSDTLALHGSGMPSSSALYFQGTAQSSAGAGVVFGDGKRCAGGTTIRLGTKTNALGNSSFPEGADPVVSVRGANSAGDVRTYQCWYRNAAAFCTADTFNLTNGYQLAWGP